MSLDYIQKGVEAKKNKFPWLGEISIKIISDECHFSTCLHIDKVSAVCLSASERWPCQCCKIRPTTWFIILILKILSAVLLVKTNSSNVCGGAIIDEKNILADADCTEGIEAQDITVWVGDNYGESDHAVCDKPELKGNFQEMKDVTMLQLCEPLTFSEGKFL